MHVVFVEPAFPANQAEFVHGLAAVGARVSAVGEAAEGTLLRFSEIGCRPPGVGTWDLYCAANDMDLYREWAAAVVHGRPLERPSRRFAAGMVNLRPDRDGRIVDCEGIAEMERAFGEWLIDAHFPPPGTPTQPVSAGYMANAWVRLRHPDYDQLRRMLAAVGKMVRVRAA